MSAPRSSTGAVRRPERGASRRAATLFLVLGVVAVRGLAFWRVPELTYDGTYYLRQAERLAHLHYDWIGFPPGYPLAVLLARIVARDAVLAGRLVSLVAGLVSLVLAYRLALRHLGRRLALVVVWGLALHPYLVRVQVETLSESLYLALVLGAFLGFESRRDLAAGALLGAAFLVRPEAALLLGGLLALRTWTDRRPPWRLAVGLVPIVLFAAIASRALGHLVLSPKQGQLDLGPAFADRLQALGRALFVCFPLVLLPGAVGRGLRRAPHLVLTGLYIVTIPLFAIHVQERLVLPALPFLLVLGVGWAAALGARWQRPVAITAALLFVWGSVAGWRNLMTSGPLTPRAREIGAALRPALRFDSRVAGRFPLVPYFAGAGFVRAPRTEACTVLLDSIRTLGATHLVVLESEMRNVLPQLRPLFDDARFATSEGRLRPVMRLENPPGNRAILYEVTQPPLVPSSVDRAGAPMASSVWIRGRCLAATADGALVWVPGGEPAGTAPGPVRELATDAAMSHLVGAIASGAGSVLASRELPDGEWRTHPATAADAPASPAFASSTVLYVARARAALRALDLRSGAVRDVEIAGVTREVATPERVSARGTSVAVTFIPAARPTPETRIVAIAELPANPAGDPLVLAGHWASQLRLYDSATGWSADGARVFVCALVTDLEGKVLPERASLCILEQGGYLRRLSYGLDRVRRPEATTERIAFLAGDATLCTAALSASALAVPRPLTFESLLAPSSPPPR